MHIAFKDDSHQHRRNKPKMFCEMLNEVKSIESEKIISKIITEFLLCHTTEIKKNTDTKLRIDFFPTRSVPLVPYCISK